MSSIVAGCAHRLGIFCFYNPKGHAPRYVQVLLEALTPHLSELAVVVNGELDDESRVMFSGYAKKIIVKDNEGLDVAAYRMGMLDYGWDALKAFDEVICFNDTVMGPVCPFADMFENMDARGVDFWGITTYPAEALDGEDIPTHLQAYWHAYRRSLVSSNVFREYWERLCDLRDYAEVTREHEMKFTKRFEELGFVWDSYIDPGKFADLTPYPMLYAPMQLLRDTPCPVFKRRSFFLDFDFYFDQTAGQPALELFEYLRDHTDYDTDLIWDAVLPYYNIASIARALHLNYVLPSSSLNSRRGEAPRAAFIFQAQDLDMLDVTFGALSVLPESVDLFVTCAPEKIDSIAGYADTHSFSKHIEFIPVQNRGRDVSALLVGACDVVLSRGYEVIGFAHDKKSAQNQQNGSHGSISQGFTYKLMQNTLGSRDYVENILTLFADDPRLGLVCPPPPFQGIYYPVTMPNDWGPNFEKTRELLHERLGIDVPLDPRISTRSALGSCYWFRVDALRPLFEYGWSYEDFLPEGEMGPDGSISHAIERATGYIAQSQGYYPAWVMTDRYARIEIDSLFHSTDRLLSAMGPYRRGGTLVGICGELGARLRPFGMFKWRIHKFVSKVFRVVAKPLPDSARIRLKRVGWRFVHSCYALLRR